MAQWYEELFRDFAENTIRKALQPEGKLIFTTLNGLYPLFHSVRQRNSTSI